MAIDPKLVSIVPASQLPTGDPTSAADFLFYEGEALKKGSMSNIYDKVTSGIKGVATQTNAPTAYTTGYLFERYIVTAPITSPNSWGNIAVTQAELNANYVYFNVTNGVVTKDLSLKPTVPLAQTLGTSTTTALSQKGANDVNESRLLSTGVKIAITASKFIPFFAKKDDVIRVIISDYVGTEPNNTISVTLTATEAVVAPYKTVASNATANGTFAALATDDYNFAYFYKNPAGNATFSARIETIPFERIKNWVLSESYAISILTYDTYGNIKTANLTFPDGTPGLIATSTADTSGRLLTITYTFGVAPTLMTLKQTITYTGELITTIIEKL